ncbi:MAG: lysostaphin resistance A-like protein [Stackebrandtia sp.]
MDTEEHIKYPGSAEELKPRLAPGWRIPLTIIGVLGFVACGIPVALALDAAGMPQTPQRLIVTASMAAAGTAVAYLLWRYIDRRPWKDLWPSTGRTAPLHLLAGTALAIGVMLLAKATTVTVGVSDWTAPRFGDGLNPAMSMALLLIGILLGQAFPEELLWRGYLYTSLRRQWTQWASVVAVSAGFGVMHLLSMPSADLTIKVRLLYALMAIGMGFALASCRVLTGTIWLGVGFHAGHNLTNNLVISNGSQSMIALLNFAVLAVFGVVMLSLSRRLRRNR